MLQFIAQYWIEFAFVTILGVVSKIAVQFIAFKKGMQSLLRDRIIQSYNHYMDKGYCPIYAQESINEMYESYHKLGGNGTVTKLYNEIITLPTEMTERNNKNESKIY